MALPEQSSICSMGPVAALVAVLWGVTLCDDGLFGNWSGIRDVVVLALESRWRLWTARQSLNHVTDVPAKYAANRFEVPAYVAPVIMANKTLV
jgi:hypothetical protein